MVGMARARMLATVDYVSDGRQGVCAPAGNYWMHEHWSARHVLATFDYMIDGRHGA